MPFSGSTSTAHTQCTNSHAGKTLTDIRKSKEKMLNPLKTKEGEGKKEGRSRQEEKVYLSLDLGNVGALCSYP